MEPYTKLSVDEEDGGVKPITKLIDRHSQVGPTHRGPIPGILVGKVWDTRMDCSKDAVHRPPVAGIAGCVANGGAVSIVLSGGYIGNEDYGDHFAYSGSGSDGNLKGVNMAMAITCAANFGIENVPNSAKAKDWRKSKAIRVVRGSKGDKNYSPKAGYRYDGIYKIHMYEKVTDNQVTTFRYHLRRDDPRPPPWKKGNSNVSRPSRKSVCERRESSSGKVLTSHTKSRG